MQLYQLPPRVINFETHPSNVNFPLDVDIEVTLHPPELFGAATFTNTLREFPQNAGGTQDLLVSWSEFEGPDRIGTTDSVSFNEFKFEGLFSGTKLEIKGNIAKFSFSCVDSYSLSCIVNEIIEQFPASFVCSTKTPVSIKCMKGLGNGYPFTVRIAESSRFRGSFSITNTLHREISESLKELLPEAEHLPVQVTAAMRYLSQAFLLESVSKYDYHFVAERMLNICKSVESLTLEKGDKVEDMRSLLRGWGVHDRYIDIFASIRYLRSQLDIAHIAYTRISTEAHRKIQEFIPVAEGCTQALILTAIRQAKKDSNTYKNIKRKIEEQTVIKKLAEYNGVILDGSGDLTKYNKQK